MPFSRDKLRLHLTFLDELERVHVLGARNRFGVSLCDLGLVTSGAALQELLQIACIDHYIICSGNLSANTFEVRLYELSPKAILETLEKGFHRAAEIEMKILEGSELTGEENSFAVPNTLWLYSSSLEMEEGSKRACDWFHTPRVDARPFIKALHTH